MDVKEKIKQLPNSAGVYLFKDLAGKIIYIGKAKNLKKRVGSYFNRPALGKTAKLVLNISDVEYISTPTEIDALIKEAQLIKQNLPKYNISLRDDKSFPVIRITKEAYPVISLCRLQKKKEAKDKAIYFGPFTGSFVVKEAIKVIRGVFGFRSCEKLPKRACLYYRINLCPGPCIGAASLRDYQETVKNIVLFLEGKRDELINRLSKKMQELSKEKKFEEAAVVRDQIAALTFVRRRNQGAADFLSEVESLKAALNLARAPERIEAFDISNIMGKEACGSMVSFFNGSSDKNNYRRFKIKTVERIDDYAMMREIIRRRYSRVVKENLKQPGLVVIDGGKGHLQAAAQELKQLGLSLPIIGIAKEKENIYLPGRPRPIRLQPASKALHLLQRIRNEAHRFALSYHRVLRRKKVLG